VFYGSVRGDDYHRFEIDNGYSATTCERLLQSGLSKTYHLGET